MSFSSSSDAEPVANKNQPEALAPAEAAAQTPNPAPWDDLPSLREFLSRHLQQTASEPAPTTNGPTSPGRSPATAASPYRFISPQRPAPKATGSDASIGTVGQRLNQLDCELGAALEQYLPTPSFRLKMTHNRLQQDIAALEAKLELYHEVDAAPSEAVQQQHQVLMRRLAFLRNRQEDVHTQLQQTLAALPPLERMKTRCLQWLRQGMRHWQAWFSSEAVAGPAPATHEARASFSPAVLARNPFQQRLVALNHQLDALQGLMREQLRQGQGAGSNPEALSTLLAQYEKQVREGEKLRRVLLGRQNAYQRLNAACRQWLVGTINWVLGYTPL